MVQDSLLQQANVGILSKVHDVQDLAPPSVTRRDEASSMYVVIGVISYFMQVSYMPG